MRKGFKIAACCFLAVFISSTCMAAEMYVSAHAGLSVMDDSEVKGSDLEFDPGLALRASIGGWISDRMRIEPEISYQENDFDKYSLSGAGSSSMSGDFSNLSFMTNFYYDFVNKSPFTPFISAGLGFARLSANDIKIDDINDPALTDDDDSVLAYQAGAGLAWSVNENLFMDFTYRFYATEDADFSNYDVEVRSHNLYLGVRKAF
ncbi:MAG: outer membrane protein [Thermodesulfobacteriota bacterium]